MLAQRLLHPVGPCARVAADQGHALICRHICGQTLQGQAFAGPVGPCQQHMVPLACQELGHVHRGCHGAGLHQDRAVRQGPVRCGQLSGPWHPVSVGWPVP